MCVCVCVFVCVCAPLGGITIKYRRAVHARAPPCKGMRFRDAIDAGSYALYSAVRLLRLHTNAESIFIIMLRPPSHVGSFRSCAGCNAARCKFMRGRKVTRIKGDNKTPFRQHCMCGCVLHAWHNKHIHSIAARSAHCASASGAEPACAVGRACSQEIIPKLCRRACVFAGRARARGKPSPEPVEATSIGYALNMNAATTHRKSAVRRRTETIILCECDVDCFRFARAP